MCSNDILFWALFALVFGVPMSVWPYELARIDESLDAIGRKPSGRVEPAEWTVKVNRIVGIVFLVFGGGYLTYCVVVLS